MADRIPTNETFRTGLPALDQRLIPEGLPARSLNVIGGGPGTGKTILALQMLFANARPDNRAIYFTTISEPTVKFLAYLQNLDFYDPQKMFSSIVVRDIGEAIQTQPLTLVIETINQAIAEEEARLVVIDSFKAISDIVPQADQLRIFAYNLAVNLVSAMCTAFLVGEYTLADMAEVPIFAIADGILFLSFQQEGLNRQRYLEVHKVRGRRFFPGLHPFTISDSGLTIYPRIKTPEAFPEYEVRDERVSTGLPSLDKMLDGGLPRGTATMVAGGAGTGKTLLGLHFITAGIEWGEPGVIVTFQENPVQLRQIAASFGWDLQALERQGRLVHFYHSPVEIQPDIHAARVRAAVEQVGAQRVLIDSIKDIEIATPDKVRYKDYIYSLVNDFKTQGITTVLTNEIPELFGAFQLSEYGISFIADNVILLRYVELASRMSRALSVLKVRGSQHSKEIRQFEITRRGIHIGEPLRAVTGVLSGTPVMAEPGTMMQLPLRGRYVLETLARLGSATLEELERETGINPADLTRELEELQQQGVVIDSGGRYKPAV